MRHLPILMGAAALGVCLSAGSGQAGAAPLLPLSDSASKGLPVETVGYYGRRWYGGGGCYRPYGYRSYGYWGGYRPYRRHGWRYGY
jgi:hypothetical protein